MTVDLQACSQVNPIAHRRMNPMTKEVMELQVNNSTCEAADCFEKAATKIDVTVGKLGSISLDLCIECVKKFQENSLTE